MWPAYDIIVWLADWLLADIAVAQWLMPRIVAGR